MATNIEKQVEMIGWLDVLKKYAKGKKWDTGGPWVCEAHPLMPYQGGYSFDCDCGAPGMPPCIVVSKQEWKCPECGQEGSYEDIRKPLDSGVDKCPNCSEEVKCLE